MEAAGGGGEDKAASSSAPTAPQCCADEVEGQPETGDGSDQDGADSEEHDHGFVPGPLLSLRDEFDKDKEDESLRRWKEKLLGSVQETAGNMETEVIFHSIGIISDGCSETMTTLHTENQNCMLFSLKEGSQYRLKLKFSVKHNLVCGLNYVNTVWKKGIRVDQSRGMLGTFAPQRDPYELLLEEETTPSGALARGVYTAKLKFEDDDKRNHLELDYCFEIGKT